MQNAFVASTQADRLPGGAWVSGGAARHGYLELRGRELTLCPDDAVASAVALPIDGAQFERGGNRQSLLFVRHTSRPDVVLFTEDFAGLEELLRVRAPRVAEELERLRRHRRWKAWAALGAGLAVLAALALGLWWAKDPLLQAAARQVPPDWERSLAEVGLTQLRGQLDFVTDEALLAELEELGRPVLDAASTERDYPWRLHLVDSSQVNAMALPGGDIVVFSGLVLAASRPEQVQGVLAHEAAHATHQHGVRAMLGQIGLIVTLQILVGDAASAWAILVDQGGALLGLRMSRELEAEADAAGFEYMVRAGLDPSARREFFQVMAERDEGALPTIGILSTHPEHADRIEALAALEAELATGDWRQPFGDFEQFQARVRSGGGTGTSPAPPSSDRHDEESAP